MDKHTYRILEFDRILEMAAGFAGTEPGAVYLKDLRPLDNIDRIREESALVSECRRFLSAGEHPGIEFFEDLKPLFRRIRPDEAVLDASEMITFMPLFNSLIWLRKFTNSPNYPGLEKISSALLTDPDLKRSIEGTIDSEGNIFDDATPELSFIRKNIRSCEEKIKKNLERILREESLAPHLQDYFIAERNKRWVIPVKVDSKGSVKGVVHDISNTGETVYIEPFSIQQLGNELEAYRTEEKLERFRILKRLSAGIREHLDEMENDYSIIVRADSIFANAGFAEQMNMSPPEINEEGYLNITGGRHPLLFKALSASGLETGIVPLNLEIGRGNKCIVVTGSNAGGKTVALKTLGVLTIMALTGMHIPASSGTTVPLLAEILADIGDEQSIDQNLSTFTAHMGRISEIIRKGKKDSLIIIDELGTGTDPEQGGALSSALLKRLKNQGAIIAVSTHLGMLKAFAHSEPGLINAAMEMEEVIEKEPDKHMAGKSCEIKERTRYRPTYRLVMGETGSSHAFEIAGSIGLDQELLDDAREILSGEGALLDTLMQELEEKRVELDINLKETERNRQEASELRLRWKEELSELEKERKSKIADALRRAEEIIVQTKREAREIIDRLKESRSLSIKSTIKELKKRGEAIKEELKQYSPDKTAEIQDLSEGKTVYVDTLKIHGIVRAINYKTGRCRVDVRGKEITVPLTALFEPSGEYQEKKASVKHLDEETDRSIIDADLPVELNLIGQRVDPSLSAVERYLNDASLAGLKSIKIIHGIGEGVLSKAIREYLKGHPLVESYNKGSEEEGGDGVTVVNL